MKQNPFFSKGILIPFFIIIILVSNVTSAQVNVSVDVNIILNNVENKSLGINVNYLMDDSFLSPAPFISTKDALKSMGVRFLRYPGGEKSDNYFFDSGTYGTPLIPVFARTGPNEWPSGDSRFASADFKRPKSLTMDFDEFITVCHYVDASPLVVLPYDCIYKTATAGGTIPTKEDVLRNAEEWVRYSNITRSYGVKYWMIGNESYNTGSYNGTATAVQYRNDIILFSERMKTIDPGIKIIINGDSDSWWASVLPSTSAFVDYLGVSNYPVWNYTGGYEYYRTHSPDLIGSIHRAINGINNYAPDADKNRLKIIATEFNSMDWSKTWPDRNDLGHALLVFDIIGEQLKLPAVEFSCFWNTRWVENKVKEDEIFDALSKTGEPNANGLALSVWGNFLLDKMVSATSTSKIKVFASYSASTGKLNVYLINKEFIEQEVNIILNNYSSSATGTKWEFKGTGESDISPEFTNAGSIVLTTNNIHTSLPATSITVFELHSSETQVINPKSKEEITIYPNPVKEHHFTVNLESGTSGYKSIYLYNVSGNLVKKVKPEFNSTFSISLPQDLKPGIYFIKFVNENIAITKMLSIQ